jgi:Rad3-related DNA helicase
MNEELLMQFVDATFGKDFEFRKYQKEAILDILDTYDTKTKKNYLLSAPTGAGKSRIAICVAGVLAMKGLKGYILTSDLALHDQYEADISRYNLSFGHCKGIDNYLCSENGEKHSLGDCKIRHLNPHAIKGLDCYRECPYYSRRDHASKADVVVTTYSYWLVQMNYVMEKMEDPLFVERDFTICDEAHKVTGIVQKHFSPVINDNTFSMIERLRTFLAEHNMAVDYSGSEIKDVLNKIAACEDNTKLLMYNKQFEKIMWSFVEHADEIKKFVGKKYAGKQIPKEWLKGMNLCDFAKDVHCKFEDYNKIIINTDIRAMIKNMNGTNIQFNCIDERYLMEKHFHDKTKFSTFMTATMGDPKEFLKSVKGNNARSNVMQSTFDFSKSPIYVYMTKSMSFKNKEASFPWVIGKIDEIIKSHEGLNGIIHSGSYANSKKIYEGLKDNSRIIMYNGSDEKKESLFDFSGTAGKILMGPSILEGIDLYDDKSRFQIFAKVPYASLGDKFVSTKMKIDPEWYSFQAILHMLQGVGRSVRNEQDWAETFILDSDVMILLRKYKKHFPQDFLDRCYYIQ